MKVLIDRKMIFNLEWREYFVIQPSGLLDQSVAGKGAFERKESLSKLKASRSTIDPHTKVFLQNFFPVKQLVKHTSNLVT